MKSETAKRHFINLPEESHPDYFRVLVRNCITAYAKLFNDKYALDFNKVVGSMRTLIMEDKEYQQETRSIKAQQMMNEAEEIEELALLAEGEGDPNSKDPREKGKKRKITGADKDMLNMRFKAAQMRRDLLNLNAANDEQEEANAINLFFIPVGREEFEKLETVELNNGTDDGHHALAEEINKNLPTKGEVEKRLAEAQDAVEEKYAEMDKDLFKVNPDGSIEEV
jgi:hypothetical protein